jgi:hypothetical protein
MVTAVIEAVFGDESLNRVPQYGNETVALAKVVVGGGIERYVATDKIDILPHHVMKEFDAKTANTVIVGQISEVALPVLTVDYIGGSGSRYGSLGEGVAHPE